MNILIFTNDIGGHHLEYIHHMHDVASKDPNNNYIFLIPNGFSEISHNYDWPDSNNVKFVLFDNSFLGGVNKCIRSQLLYSLKITKFINDYIKKYSVQKIFVNTLIDFIFAAPFLLSKRASLSGIIYKIYLRDPNISKLRSFAEDIVFYIASKSSVFKSIFILNDKDSTLKLNKKFNSNKFVDIIDPYTPLLLNKNYHFRIKYNISYDKKLFVVLGALNTNKGVIEVLDSILLLSPIDKEKFYFVFAGKVSDDIRDKFYKKYYECKKHASILLFDEFCTYGLFANICHECDAILLPYKRVAQSSGMVGYAAQFDKPVIAPSKGLIGDIVSQYKMGLQLDQLTPESLRDAYLEFIQKDIKVDGNSYCKGHSIEEFKKIIKDNI